MQNSPYAADADMDIKEYIIGRVRSGGALCFFAALVCFFVKGWKVYGFALQYWTLGEGSGCRFQELMRETTEGAFLFVQKGLWPRSFQN